MQVLLFFLDCELFPKDGWHLNDISIKFSYRKVESVEKMYINRIN